MAGSRQSHPGSCLTFYMGVLLELRFLTADFFSNPHFSWLGASPDRLVYDLNARPTTDGLEVKCIESAQGMTPMEAYQMKRTPKEGKKKSFRLKIKDGNLQLDESQLLLSGPGSRSIRNGMV